MGHGRHNLATAGRDEISKNEIDNGSSYICEGIAIKEEKRGAAMALP